MGKIRMARVPLDERPYPILERFIRGFIRGGNGRKKRRGEEGVASKGTIKTITRTMKRTMVKEGRKDGSGG